MVSRMSDSCVLAIDLGTGGPKVALVTRAGHAIAWASEPVSTTLVGGGGAEQDPRQMWAAIVTATRTVLTMTEPVPPIAAVAVTSQYMSTIPVRSNGTPTGPCVLWMDTRGAAHNQSLLTDETFTLFVERHGLIPLPSGNDNVAHIHVLREHHPDAYAQADAFVEPMDYINARLTGRVRATQSSVFGQLACDNRTWGVTEYDHELVAATGLDPEKLALLVPLGGFIGEVTSTAAGELGIAAGIPVIAGTIDSITAAVGSGALGPENGSVIIGTTSVMVSHVRHYGGDLGSGILTVPSPVPESYYVMAENGVGGKALEWAAQLFGYGDVAAAIGDAVAVAPGADGVQFMPWLLGSIAPRPDDDVRAAFAGLSLRHDRRHLLRAAVEGVALNLAWLLPAVEQFCGHQWPAIHFGGGAAQSDLVAQVLADALDRPVRQLAQPRLTNARGAAFLAFAELGALNLSDVAGLVVVEHVRDPDPRQRSTMDAALGQMIALHPSLSSFAAS